MKRVLKTIENLRKNNMLGYYVEDRKDLVSLISGLLSEGDRVAVGAYSGLYESGVIDHLHSGRYRLLDRYHSVASSKKALDLDIDVFSADAYIACCSAVTEAGELCHADGSSYRTAAICYGPRSVILVVGWNRLVRDAEEAIMRRQSGTLSRKCTKSVCGCSCYLKEILPKSTALPAGICCNYAVSAYQRIQNRIKVILVGENLDA